MNWSNVIIHEIKRIVGISSPNSNSISLPQYYHEEISSDTSKYLSQKVWR